MWLPQVVRHHEALTPHNLALRDLRRDVTWRDFARDVDATAAWLLGQCPVGSRVLVLSANRVEMLETYVACAAAGMVAAPVNPGLADAELAYIVASVRPAVAMAMRRGASGWPVATRGCRRFPSRNWPTCPPPHRTMGPPT